MEADGAQGVVYVLHEDGVVQSWAVNDTGGESGGGSDRLLASDPLVTAEPTPRAAGRGSLTAL